jgi:glycine/D-amino acid oxidase-like deaminating enzyme
VRLASGDRIAAGAVVIAAGAWGASLGASCGAPLPLQPRRRHLAQLDAGPPADPGAPVVWCLGDELYYRPESGGLLACPCDGDPWPPELPAPAESGVELLAKKLARLAPRLSEASVRRAWACLRTFAPDGAAVVGPDGRLPGLFWLAGLGGHGMTGGMAAGEILAATFMGRQHPLAAALAPSRWA